MNHRLSWREKYLLSVGIVRVLDERYATLLRPKGALELIVTNLRNQPLSLENLDSVEDCIVSLYHNLVTGSKNFPSIPVRGFLRSRLLTTPFRCPPQNEKENTIPSPLTDLPGMMIPPAGSSSRPQILTPVLPEKMTPLVLEADKRNSVLNVVIHGRPVTRVISSVYRTEDTELTNHWRVTQYSAEGTIQMSVLCHFTKKSARQVKRRHGEEVSRSSSPSPPRKLLRL